MLENIYGPFNGFRKKDKYEQLWSKLAPIYGEKPISQSGLTQLKNEIIELWQLFDRMQPRIIVEIGVAQGGSFSGWCQLAPDDALLIGIDRDPNDCLPRYREQVHPDIANYTEERTDQGGGIFALARRSSNQTVIPIRGWSHDPKVLVTLLDILDERKIDFLFHDASHQAEMTVRDFGIYWPLIADGGAMAFHDISYTEVPDVDKWKWWKEVEENGPHSASYSYKTNHKGLSMGIGVLFK